MKLEVISVQDLLGWSSRILHVAGVSMNYAEITAKVLVEADLRGLDSHGVSRLPVYVKNVRSGRFSNSKVKVLKVDGSTAVVNGNNCIGPAVAKSAMDLAISLAHQYGIGAVAVRNSNHLGMASFYTNMAASKHMIGMVFSNTPSAMPPTGGKTPFFGTNPLAISFPMQDNMIEIDMSTSVVARGKIIQAIKAEQTIPIGWAVDSLGEPTTDASLALDGSLLPIGGAKGYALALAIEIFSSVLTGSAWGPHIGWMYDDKVDPVRIGHFMIVVDIRRFLPWEMYLRQMDQLRYEIKSVEKATGVDEILLPGERRSRLAAQRLALGIPLASTTVSELRDVSNSLMVPWLNEKETQ